MSEIKNIEVKVLTPEKTIYDGPADYVSIPAKEGVIGVFKRHTPFFSIVEQGEVVIENNKTKEYLAVLGGFVDVGPDHVTILADLASTSEQLDEIKITEAKKRAEERLSENLSQQDYAATQAELRKTILDLKVSRRRRSSPHPS